MVKKIIKAIEYTDDGKKWEVEEEWDCTIDEDGKKVDILVRIINRVEVDNLDDDKRLLNKIAELEARIAELEKN